MNSSESCLHADLDDPEARPYYPPSPDDRTHYYARPNHAFARQAAEPYSYERPEYRERPQEPHPPHIVPPMENVYPDDQFHNPRPIYRPTRDQGPSYGRPRRDPRSGSRQPPVDGFDVHSPEREPHIRGFYEDFPDSPEFGDDNLQGLGRQRGSNLPRRSARGNTLRRTEEDDEED